MNKRINVITFATVLILLLALGLNTGFGMVMNRDIIISKETILQGSLAATFDQTFGDVFTGKDNWLALSEKINTLKGIKSENQLEIVSTDGINVATQTLGEGVKSTDWGSILINDGVAMEMLTYNAEAHVAYPKAINQLGMTTDIETFLLLVPTQIEFQESAVYEGLSYSQANSIKEIYGQLDSSINAIEVYDDLNAHKNDYIYFRTDHHWTSKGAYYVYETMGDILGYKPYEIKEMKVLEKENYLGSLYNLTHSDVLEKNPDKLTVYFPDIETEYLVQSGEQWNKGKVIDEYFLGIDGQEYAVFLGGDSALSIIKNHEGSGKLMIIKDSYANALIPFLAAHYEEIHIVDPRMYEGDLSAHIKDNEIDQLLIINYVLVNRYMGYAEMYEQLSN